MKTTVSIVAFILLFPILVTAGEPNDFEKNWPQWRGPFANGVAPYGNPPVEWSEDKNVKWKIEIPGKGHASPIIWGDQIFVLTATDNKVESESQPEMHARPEGQPRGQSGQGRRRGRRGFRGIKPTNIQRFEVMAINRSDGRILWRHTAREALPHEGTHGTSTWASSSPVTDGKHLYTSFGSHGLYCYDLNGNLKWQKDFGDMRTRNAFGEGSSPVIYDDKVVVQWDHEGQSFIVVVDKSTGNEVWRADRDERTSWSTPLVVESNGKAQVITSATNRIRSYDLATGEVLWESSGMTVNAIPTPVTANGIVYVMSGFRGNALQAIRLADAKGDIAGSAALVWTLDKDTPYTPSPLLYDDNLYFLKHNRGILSSYNANTGEAFFGRQRLEGIEGIYASPVGANGRVYILSRNGVANVIKHGRPFEILSTNRLDDGFSASPAVVGNDLYLRGHKYLYCISSD